MEQRKITRSDLVSMFLRSNLQQASFNFERIHGLGFCYDMIPAIKRLYPLKEDQVAALRRHLVFFNTTPAVCGPVIGVTAAMEEARANGAEIDLLQKLTEGASILGLFVMGVLVTKWTSINVPLVVSQTPAADGATVTITVQNILDQLCPGLLALGLTLLMVRLLNKKINPVWLIFALFGLGIIGNALGFLS